MEVAGADQELVITWIEEFKVCPMDYFEPILDSATVDLIKYSCEVLKQDSHVFIMTVDLLNKYITIMNERNTEIKDQLLVTLCIVCICSKHVGELSDLKFTSVVKFYENLTHVVVRKNVFKRTEIKILETLNETLPMFSTIDDLKILTLIYVKKLKLAVDISKLCVDILEVVYIYYRRLFYKLRNVYRQTSDTEEMFKRIVTNRLYLPGGILLAGLKLTKLQNVISLEYLVREISDFAEIHHNHVELLSTYILDVINGKFK